MSTDSLNSPPVMTSTTDSPAIEAKEIRGMRSGAALGLVSAALTACGAGSTTATPESAGSAASSVTPATATGGTAPPTDTSPATTTTTTSTTPPATENPVAAPAPPTVKAAARFLGQAANSTSRLEIQNLQKSGLAAWIEDQFLLPADTGHWDWMVQKGYAVLANQFNEEGIDASLWRRMITAGDPLRVRMALALSEIFVIGISGMDISFRQFAAANFMDILERNAFGNYRKLIEEISTSTAMGVFLSFLGNVKADAATGRLPDENYAREIMQLFSIGLLELNVDGTPKLTGNKPVETYDQADVSGLARVFTGWNYDSTDSTTPDRNRRPMVNTASKHESGAKQFLGVTIAAGTSAAQSLTLALDTLLNHPNTGPFISKQLIQRLVTSNPSPAYVGRVASVFNSTKNVGGDFKAVLRAILLDPEAGDETLAATTGAGRVREPMLRFIQWARTFKGYSPTGNWKIGSTADAATRLGQSPLRSPSVFNFFRPGYVPPGTALGAQGLVSPELQIANESSMVGYINFMQNAISNSLAEIKADYSEWIGGVGNTQYLLDDLNLVLASNQITSGTLSTIKAAIDTINISTPAGQLNRLYAAILLVMVCPEYLVHK